MKNLIVNAKIETVLKAAYDNSKPQGLGYMQFKEGSLSKSELSRICEQSKYQDFSTKNDAWSFDYIFGRAIKLTVVKISDENLELSITDDNGTYRWFDHTNENVKNLLQQL